MTVKELILEQNFEEIISYMTEHYVSEYEDKEKNKETFQMGFRLTIEDIKNTIPKEDTETIVYGFPYREYFEGKLEENIETCVIKLSQLKEMETNYEINTLEDRKNKKYPEHWSLMFVDWETILGYEVIKNDFVSNLALACDILWELTFFGYTKEKNKEKSKEEETELMNSIREIEEGTCETISVDDDYFFDIEKECSLYDGLSEEEIEEKRKNDKIERELDYEKTTEEILVRLKKEFEFLKKLKKKFEKEKWL